MSAWIAVRLRSGSRNSRATPGRMENGMCAARYDAVFRADNTLVNASK